jgi:hypothetical protein
LNNQKKKRAVCLETWQLLTAYAFKKKVKKGGGGKAVRTRSSLSTRAAASKYTKKLKKMPFGQRMPRKQAADGVSGISVICWCMQALLQALLQALMEYLDGVEYLVYQ